MRQFTIDLEQAGKRVDVFLTEQLDLSRAQIQRLIKSHHVLINDEPCIPHRLIQNSDTISLLDEDPPDPLAIKPEIPTLHVLFEDDDLMVIHKQAGLIVHPQEGESRGYTLVDALLKHHPKLAGVGEDEKRPGIVHRLDKDVSGLMVIAKNQPAYENLKSQFQNRTVFKEYVALVYGVLPKDHDVIELRIARSKARGRMVARPNSQDGKEAKTEYDVIEFFKNHTLAKVILHTGRTHQIRVHFRAIDHPIVGDKLYKKNFMRHIRPLDLDRIFLHAHILRIKLMDGTEKTFNDPLPTELKAVLENLKSSQ